jgi:hypothetical protein
MDWASIIVGGLAKGMQNLVCSCVVCCVAISASSFRQAFVRRSLMKVDCGVDCFSKLEGCLGVDHDNPSLLGDGTDHSLGYIVLVVRVWWAQFVCRIAGSEHRAGGYVIVVALAIIALELFYLIAFLSKSIYMDVKRV